MTRNERIVDRIVRVVLWLGLIPLASGVLRCCPLYRASMRARTQ
jgi:hypothetical protein